MKRNTTIFAAACLFALLAPVYGRAQQGAKPDQFSAHQHVPLAPIPTSATAALAPSGGQAGVTLSSLYFVNTNSSTVVTVTVTCNAVVLVSAAIPGVTAGGNNVPVQFPADGVYCAVGPVWTASAAGVNGSISGRY
jgi:hypothetical protein